MSSVTMYHNPSCGSSRNTLGLIRNSGVEPTVILYLETPPSHDELKKLLADMGMPIRKLIRTNAPPYEQLGLANDLFSEDALVDAVVKHPILMNRPIVVTLKGTRLCRPPELVLDILPDPQKGSFTKENGEKIIDEHGHRIAKTS